MGIAWEVVTWNNWILSGYYVGFAFKPEGLHYKRIFPILYCCWYQQCIQLLVLFLLLASENYKWCCVANLMHLSSNSKIQIFDPKPIQVSKQFSWNEWNSGKCCLETICRQSTVTVTIQLIKMNAYAFYTLCVHESFVYITN